MGGRAPEVEAPRVAGRGLKRPQAPQPGAYPPTHAPGGMQSPGPGGATPFARNQVDFGSNAAPSSANSLSVVSIVFGLIFMLGAAAMAAVAMLAVGWYGMGRPNPLDGNDGLADKTHLRDTGAVADPEIRKLRQQQRARATKNAEDNYDPMSDMFGGLGAGPVTVYTQGAGKERYRGIEIVCGQVSFRKRAPLVKDKAHIPIVPAARCRLVFQGAVPVKSWVTGGDTVRCTFEPIVCRQI